MNEKTNKLVENAERDSALSGAKLLGRFSQLEPGGEVTVRCSSANMTRLEKHLNKLDILELDGRTEGTEYSLTISNPHEIGICENLGLVGKNQGRSL